jgi:hypothetical protein
LDGGRGGDLCEFPPEGFLPAALGDGHVCEEDGEGERGEQELVDEGAQQDMYDALCGEMDIEQSQPEIL